MPNLRVAFALLLACVIHLQGAPSDRHVILITMDGFPAYLMDDPQAPIPTLRRLAKEGAVAEGLRVSNPSITWPNHTTLVTGVEPATHSVLFNGVLVRGGPGVPARIDPRRDKSDLVAAPTVYDVLKKAGLLQVASTGPAPVTPARSTGISPTSPIRLRTPLRGYATNSWQPEF